MICPWSGESVGLPGGPIGRDRQAKAAGIVREILLLVADSAGDCPDGQKCEGNKCVLDRKNLPQALL
jgi:hypothetical protein